MVFWQGADPEGFCYEDKFHSDSLKMVTGMTLVIGVGLYDRLDWLQ